VGCARFDPEPAVAPWQVMRTNDPQLRHHRSQVTTEGLRRSDVVAVVLSPGFPLGVQFPGFDVVLTTPLAALPDESRDGGDQILELQNRLAGRFRDRERLPADSVEPVQRPAQDARKLSEQLLGQVGVLLARNEVFITSTTKRCAIAPLASPNRGSSFDKIKKRVGSFPVH